MNLKPSSPLAMPHLPNVQSAREKSERSIALWVLYSKAPGFIKQILQKRQQQVNPQKQLRLLHQLLQLRQINPGGGAAYLT